jgi:hypothetical protein
VDFIAHGLIREIEELQTYQTLNLIRYHNVRASWKEAFDGRPAHRAPLPVPARTLLQISR